MKITVPLSALSAADPDPDENPSGDGGSTPQEGDSISLDVSATVTAINGDTAELTIDTINGEAPAEAAPAKPKKKTPITDEDMQRLSAEAGDRY